MINAPRQVRAGFTLAELMMAMGVTAIIAVAMGSLASAVHSSNAYIEGQANVTQHARVAMGRIKRNIEQAHASRQFPGFCVVTTTDGGAGFPDALAVWRPAAEPHDPDGLPLVSELVIYLANPEAPNELWELTDRNNTTPAPAANQNAAWLSLLDTLSRSESADHVVLTDLVRRSLVGNSESKSRANVRFDARLRPSDLDLALYDGGTVDWDELPWAQSIYSKNRGLRQSWCRIELQLIPEANRSPSGGDSAAFSIPFFGSAALYYELER